MDGLRHIHYLFLEPYMYLDMERFSLIKKGFAIPFSPTQFLILKRLAQTLGKPVSASEIIYSVWGKNGLSSNNDLHIYINRIRKKIEDNPRKPKYLLTVRGYGYLLQTYASDEG